MKILIVDDDFVSRTKLTAILSTYGNCDVASDGETAFLMIKKAYKDNTFYNLVTMDVEMPGENGQEVVNKIKDWEKKINIFMTEKETKIIMISAKGDGKNIVKSFKKGCEQYIVKPVSPQKIKDTLKNLGIIK